MLAPLNRVEIHALLNKLPQRAQLAQERNTLLDGLEHVVDLGISREAADTETDTAVRALVAAAERAEHVAGLERGGGAGTAGGEGDVLEGHEEGFTLDVGEGDVDAAGVKVVRVAVLGGVLHGEEAGEEAVRELLDVLGVVLKDG
ncbi:hypothetical protein V492_05495 [Pseudogymnoascus sp. VKM F-4246]|nr:hypothetical protein V492_05495 [Pseudogymnoascus sp. VKM F-4246]